MATRILVVDDSPTIRTVVSTILERCGYDPKVASDGQDAYEALASGEVKADLILLDFVMPHMNGYQFCRALRDNADLAATPVVLMSAKADRIREQFVQQTGAIDAITKPFDRQALVAVIENALRKVNGNRASSARLPELESAEVPEAGTVVAPVEHETRRTHIAHVIAQKLASIAARTVSERPELASLGGDLTSALAERLSNEAVLEMMEMVGDLDRIDKNKALLAGDLGVVPIGAVLQLLQAENQTGVLVCTSGAGALRSGDRASAEVRATFRNGAIDLVQSTGAGDEFRLGRFFVEEGVLTPREIEVITEKQKGPPLATTAEVPAVLIESPPLPDVLDPSLQLGKTEEIEAIGPDTLPWVRRASSSPSSPSPVTVEDPHVVVTVPGDAVAQALAAVTEGGARDTSWGTAWSSKDTSAGTAWGLGRPKARPLGMALVAAGKIVDSQLRTALTRQSSELLYEVLRWQSGRFELRREPPSELALNAKLALPVASVVMEGFRRVDEWRALERTLGSFDAVLFRDDAAFGTLDIGSLPPKEKVVLDAVDGERTVRAIVAESHLSSFDACRILVQFLEARVLRRRATG